MPTLHEIALDQEDPPEYYGATLYFRGCKIFTEPFQRLSRPTPGSLVDAVEAELAKHADSIKLPEVRRVPLLVISTISFACRFLIQKNDFIG